ncbi:hypothetical protein [Actinophytocola sp.]|nr:hypothetical protein [Actinophytocola sp.]
MRSPRTEDPVRTGEYPVLGRLGHGVSGVFRVFPVGHERRGARAPPRDA